MADIKHDELDNNEEEMTMEQLLGPEKTMEQGKIISGTIISLTDEGVMVDLGTKSEGLILKSEFGAKGIPAEFVIGAPVNVRYVKYDPDLGTAVVSYRQVRDQEVWDKLDTAFKAATQLEGTILRKIKGGFTVDIGVEAFLPASQLELRMPKDPDSYVGKKFSFAIAELNRAQRNVVLSRRTLLEKEHKEKAGVIISSLTEGSIVDGVVTNVTDFGAFVDIGGIEGLLHIGDLAWFRVAKVTDILKTKQAVRVKVLRIDREKGKISLGLKQLAARPWDAAEERYPVDVVVKGTVSSITDFGVFVALEPGLEGLLHVSEISWNEDSRNVKSLFKPGQEVEVKVIGVDKEKEKLSLSIKRLHSNPWDDAFKHYVPGARVKGPVTHLAPFGAFVKLPEGIEGLIHVGDMSWTKKVNHPQDVVKVGDEVEVVVLEVKPKSEKISLSLKHASDDPFKKYKVGKAVTGKVLRLTDFGAFVELEPGIEALLRIGEISSEKRLENVSEALTVGQEIEAKIIKCDTKDHKLDISMRKHEKDQERALVKKYANTDERPTLGQMLQDDSEERD
jgi:small subunit ribosomal protein S1